MKNRSHGNKERQQKKRRERLKHRGKPLKEWYEIIDGNFTHYPVGYCCFHNGYLTDGLVETHRCHKRNCERFRTMEQVKDHDKEKILSSS